MLRLALLATNAKMQKLVIIPSVLLFVSLYFMHGAGGQETRLQKRSSVRACGRSLSQLISFVCQGVYNEPVAVKRDSVYGNPDDDAELTNQENTETDNEDYVLPMFRKRRGSRGVVDECCRQSCTFSTLRSYCGRNPNK